MKTLGNILWWLAFVYAAIALQAFVPSVDVLTCGVILLLQERDYHNMLWFLPLCILLQEGMGTRLFGAAILWYATVILFFNAGRWLFEAKNFLFVFLLSACLGVALYGLNWILAPLQNIDFDPQEALNASLLQAVLIPCIWWVLTYARRWHTAPRDS